VDRDTLRMRDPRIGEYAVEEDTRGAHIQQGGHCKVSQRSSGV
jgi:hypothetical protein